MPDTAYYEVGKQGSKQVSEQASTSSMDRHEAVGSRNIELATGTMTLI